MFTMGGRAGIETPRIYPGYPPTTSGYDMVNAYMHHVTCTCLGRLRVLDFYVLLVAILTQATNNTLNAYLL